MIVERRSLCLFEILMAVLMFDLGNRFLWFPNLLTHSHMRSLLSTVSLQWLALICLILGAVRTIILIRDDLLGEYEIAGRMVAASLSSLIWFFMCSAFLENFINNNAPLPPGFDMLLVQGIGELIVLYRLSTEVP